MFLLNLANNVLVNLIIFIMIICLVVLLPLIDKSICRKLKLNLEHGISENPKANRLLKLRQLILCIILAIYLIANFYLVFLSRRESSHYQVNTNFMYDLRNSLYVDIGVFGMIKDIFVQGFEIGFSHIHIEKPEDITQVLTNIMLYIPMGYLLPYTIEKLRSKKRYTVLLCFVFSFMTENVQLIFKRGFYDLDDMFFNTLGGFIGFLFFIAFAYRLTRPNWKKEENLRYRWNKRARKKTLYPYRRSLRTYRIFLTASSEEEVYSFYIDKLGFRLRGLKFSLESSESIMLVSLGSIFIEINCLNEPSDFNPQTISIKSKKIESTRKKLTKNGIEISDYMEDKFTHRRTFHVKAPDKVTIIMTE